MKTLRQLMTEEIMGYGWLDYEYKRIHLNERPTPEIYTIWLDTLSDEDFLFAYNRVREAIDRLD